MSFIISEDIKSNIQSKTNDILDTIKKGDYSPIQILTSFKKLGDEVYDFTISDKINEMKTFIDKYSDIITQYTNVSKECLINCANESNGSYHCFIDNIIDKTTPSLEVLQNQMIRKLDDLREENYDIKSMSLESFDLFKSKIQESTEFNNARSIAKRETGMLIQSRLRSIISTLDIDINEIENEWNEYSGIQFNELASIMESTQDISDALILIDEAQNSITKNAIDMIRKNQGKDVHEAFSESFNMYLIEHNITDCNIIDVIKSMTDVDISAYLLDEKLSQIEKIVFSHS